MNNQNDRDTLIEDMVTAFEQFGDEYDIHQAMQAAADVMASHLKQKYEETVEDIDPPHSFSDAYSAGFYAGINKAIEAIHKVFTK